MSDHGLTGIKKQWVGGDEVIITRAQYEALMAAASLRSRSRRAATSAAKRSDRTMNTNIECPIIERGEWSMINRRNLFGFLVVAPIGEKRSDGEIAGAETVQQIASAILRAAGEVMTSHGNDPNGTVIIAAGFAMAIRTMGENIDPKIPRIIAEILAKP